MTAPNPVIGMTSHTWDRADNLMMTSSPPMFNWVCTNCGERTRGNYPPTSPCPERIARLQNQRYM